MKTVKFTVSPRTIQSYLKELRAMAHIVTAQIGGNGRPYAVLTASFGGAIKSEMHAETAPEPLPFGGADEVAIERIETPQTVELTPVCIVDHQNPFVPETTHSGESGEATYDPRYDWTAGGVLAPWADPTPLRVPYGSVSQVPQRTFAGVMAPTVTRDLIDRSVPVKRKQPRPKGQESFLGRGQDVAAKYQRKKRHGSAPTPLRARMPTACLPDPVGAQGVGAPLPAPAGAAYEAGYVTSMIERLRARL